MDCLNQKWKPSYYSYLKILFSGLSAFNRIEVIPIPIFHISIHNCTHVALVDIVSCIAWFVIIFHMTIEKGGVSNKEQVNCSA